MVQRLAGGSSSGRASTAEKALEKLQEEGTLIAKPFQARKRSFTFPSAARLGQEVLSIENLTHGYKERRLFNEANLHVEKGQRIAFIGEPSMPSPGHCTTHSRTPSHGSASQCGA